MIDDKTHLRFKKGKYMLKLTLMDGIVSGSYEIVPYDTAKKTRPCVDCDLKGPGIRPRIIDGYTQYYCDPCYFKIRKGKI